MIYKIEEEELYCLIFWFDIDLNFKFVFEDVVNINLELLILFKNLIGFIVSLIYNFFVEMRCLKQKIKMKKCIVNI